MSASAFAAANASLFSAFGVSAAYRVGGAGEPVTVTVVRETPTADATGFGVTMRGDVELIHVRVSEAPDLAKGDTFTIGDETLTVAAAPRRDGLGTMWTAEC